MEDGRDVRFDWLINQVRSYFRHLSKERLDAFEHDEENRVTCFKFLDNVSCTVIFFQECKGTAPIKAFSNGNPPESLVSKSCNHGPTSQASAILYLLKEENRRIEKPYEDWVVSGDLQGPVPSLSQLVVLSREVYSAVVHGMFPQPASVLCKFRSYSSSSPGKQEEQRGQTFPSVVAKDVMERFLNFLANLEVIQGQVEGATALPVPDWVPDTVTDSPASDDANDKREEQMYQRATLMLSAKDRVHLLESTIVCWTKQIRSILILDPDGLGSQASALDELEFWQQKARNLNGCFKQLESLRVKRVLKYLDHHKSTYIAPFAKICKEVFKARNEANDTVKFLEVLRPWLEKLESREVPLPDLPPLFQPILRLALHIWMRSGYYNTPARLAVLIKEFSNTIIRKACDYVSGRQIFELIEEGETPKAVTMIRNVLRTFGKFKSVYFDYKAKSVMDCPKNPWSIQNHAIFSHVDSFLERLHDLLDIAQTSLQYGKLADTEIGGTKGKTLNLSVSQVHHDYFQVLNHLRSTSTDLMDIDKKVFEDLYYEFRVKVKEFDRRLASVILQALDDAQTISGRFKVLESFESVIKRIIIAEELEKQYVSLIKSYKDDLKSTHQVFLEHRNQKPPAPMGPNLPPIAGAVSWCRGLFDRISQPMEKIKRLDRKVLERADARDVVRMYTAFIGQLKEFERGMIEQWGQSIEQSSQEKLKNPLLKRGYEMKENGKGIKTVLIVNFDPLLIRLLREVKYFRQLGLPVPRSAMTIYDKSQILRQHMANLDMITFLYNEFQTNFHPVERPLFQAQIDRIDNCLAQGIHDRSDSQETSRTSNKVMTPRSPQPLDSERDSDIFSTKDSIQDSIFSLMGSPEHDDSSRKRMSSVTLRLQQKRWVAQGISSYHTLTWKSTGVDTFINEAMTEVKNTNERMGILKGNMHSIQEIMRNWTFNPLFQRQSKPSSLSDFVGLQHTLKSQRYSLVKEGGQTIAKLLKDTNRRLKISQGLPEWRAFIDYVNDMVCEGLIQLVLTSLKAMLEQLDPEDTAKRGLPPFLEVELDLVAKQVVYLPELISNRPKLKTAATALIRRIAAKEDTDMQTKPLSDILKHLILNIFGLGGVFRRLDSNEGTYLYEIQEDHRVRYLVAQINSQIRKLSQEANEFIKQFVPFSHLWCQDIKSEFKRFLEKARPQDRRRSSVMHDKSGAAHVEEHDTLVYGLGNIKLAQFEHKIRFYKNLQIQVADLRPVHDCYCVRVNCLPLKQAIGSWVHKWIYTFTSYLQDNIYVEIKGLSDFMLQVNEGMDVNVQSLSGDREHLMELMVFIKSVRDQMDVMGKTWFHPFHEQLALLKQLGFAVELPQVRHQPCLEFMEAAPLLWDDTVNKAFRVKEEVQPIQNEMVDAIREEEHQFTHYTSKLVTNFRNSKPFILPHKKSRDAYSSIDKFERELKLAETRAKELYHIETLFELPAGRYQILAEARQIARQLKMVWDMTCLVDSLFEAWSQLLWTHVDTEDLLMETKQLQKQVLSLPKQTRDWPVYADLNGRIKNMVTTLPLLNELHSPAMRDRHWTQVMQISGKSIVKGPYFSMKDVMQLEIHNHVDEIVQAVEIANKELKVENKLQTIEEYWDSLFLELTQYRDSDVWILAPPDEVLESLEEHQMQLQAITGMGRSADFFKDKLTHWQSYLGDVEFALKILLEVQNMWCSLEPIFLASEDIRSQLPDDAKRFEGVDTDFRDLLKDIHTRDGSVDRIKILAGDDYLASMKQILELCRKSLNEYLDTKKAFFPRFFFISNTAMLDIMSNGNNPPKVIPHLSSLFEGISKLKMHGPNDEDYDKYLKRLMTCKSWRSIRHGIKVVRAVSTDSIKTPRPLDVSTSSGFRPTQDNNSGFLSPGTPSARPGTPSARDGTNSPPMTPGAFGATTFFGPEGEPIPRFIPTDAFAMVSKEKEEVQFRQLLDLRGQVEVWLTRLGGAVSDTLRFQLEQALVDAVHWEIDRPREEWVTAVPAQLALLASQIIWSEEMENVLDECESGMEDAVRNYLETCIKRLEGLIRLVQGYLTPSERTKVITLITTDVHNRDVVQMLVKKRVESSLDFGWTSQIRYYAHLEEKAVSNEIAIHVCDFATVYCWEYVGNCGRLVITPLTDRCYITLTTALRLMLGGAPAGPAGTGKTETTKDLARALGLPCYVFNCSDQMNFQTMADIFKGLVQVGAWGCFDEFNRILIEVLSVVASQVKTIQDAIVRFSEPSNRTEEYQDLPAGLPPCKVGELEFFGDVIALVPCCGFFITMNPGYAGRTELPENLKALFRSCAMIRPDLLPICENMLMAEGFVKARPLSIKFVTLYQLSEQLLSKQAHYDWGLRAVKSVLLVAGMLKRADPQLDEEAVLMRALRDFNTPKIPTVDLAIFRRLISDIFPGMDQPPKVDKTMHKACKEACHTIDVVPDDIFVLKCLQLAELLRVRHSVMLLGPAGCGKTTVWKALAAAQNFEKSKADTVYELVNPKALTSDELYGYMTLSKDWRDGALSIVMRNMSSCQPPYYQYQESKWVILDGDIDALWIESMNTVMDDNKVLTLVSNERIPLSPSMRMVFEINSLKNATPATVSRAGILYINSTDVGYTPLVESWIQQRKSDAEKATLPNFFDQYVPRLIQIFESVVLEDSDCFVPVSPFNMVQSLIYILEALLPNISPTINKSADFLQRLFLFASIWAFGGLLFEGYGKNVRSNFNSAWRDAFARDMRMPETGTVFDYFIPLDGGDILQWHQLVDDMLTSATFDDNLPFHEIIVPTKDSIRLGYFLEMLAGRASIPVLLVGSSGTGKTSIIRQFLKSLDDDPIVSYQTINMNYYTDSAALQVQLEQPLEKRSGRSYGPPTNNRFLVFVDDLNMPMVEEYGTQTPLELLRQHIDHGGWFDRSDLGLKKLIQDVFYVTAMNHKSGSFNINQRLQRHFFAVGCQLPTDRDLISVFNQICESHFASYPDAIQTQLIKIVEGTIGIFKEISLRFLPTAIKFHYHCNMRNLAAVFQGLLRSTLEHFNTPLKVGRLWMHECNRVFSDRLITDAEVSRCQEIIGTLAKQHFPDEDESFFEEPCLFTTFESGLIEANPPYLEVKSWEHLKHTLEKKLEEYNDDGNHMMSLVLFQQAIHHIVRICRVLSQPLGNLMLVGVGGSGKQSLSQLSAFICDMNILTIKNNGEFNPIEVKEELKDVYRRAGIKPGNPLVLLITESHIPDERFLVFVNDMLSSGVIPDLFTKEEYDTIFQSLRGMARAEGIADTRSNMMNFFINRVRSNLHIVLCMSPVGDTLRTRARKFPALISCSTIDWFREWPKEALVSVASHFLHGTAGLEIADDDLLENVCAHVAEVHCSVREACKRFYRVEGRYNYTTPTSFIELVDFYGNLLAEKQMSLTQQNERLSQGLDRLHSTKVEVEAMEEQLKVKMEQVDSKKINVDALLEEMGKQRSEVEKQQALADEEKKKAIYAANEAVQIEASAAEDLAKAKPALEAAEEAVNCLNKASMTELKSFAKPPPGVTKVTTALLIMVKGEKKNYSWEKAKKMMAKVEKFKEQLEEYDSENIPDWVIEKVDLLMEDPEFNFNVMKTKSIAAANMCNWVVNTITYYKTYHGVKPLMEALKEAKDAKATAETELLKVQDVVKRLEEKLNKLQASFVEATSEKRSVEMEAKDVKDRVCLAERLTKGLESEGKRWAEEVELLQKKQTTLTGDVLLAAAFVSYLGPFTSQFRLQLWKNQWLYDMAGRMIPFSDNITPLSILTTESKIAEWKNTGLPADQMSTENGAIVTSCKRWPLLIDPQLQGINWITRMEKDRGELCTLRPGKKGLISQLCSSIQNGSTVIIESLGEIIDNALDPVIRRSLVRKGRKMFITVGDETVEYEQGFRLYLQTKLANPHFRPEIVAQCTLLNFTVTEEGLEEQLLAWTVHKVSPDLEQQRQDLIQAFNTYKIQLKDLEDLLLEQLANAPDDLLSDVSLVESLEAAKDKSLEIKKAVEEGERTQEGINRARDVYRPVAVEGSLYYFLMLKLCSVSHMYQYSLHAFINFFLRAIQKVQDEAKLLELQNQQKDKSVSSSNYSDISLSHGRRGSVRRASMLLDKDSGDAGPNVANALHTKSKVDGILDSVRRTVYTWVARGLLESHRLLFLCQMGLGLLSKGIIGSGSGFSSEGYSFLLHPKRGESISPLDWIHGSQWSLLSGLASSLPEFQKLPSDIIENTSRFQEWFNSQNPESERLPLDWRELEKQPFRKLLVVRSLRPDRIGHALGTFIADVFPQGKEFLELDSQLNSYQVLESSFETSSPIVPIYFILSPGANIVSSVDKLAKVHDMIKGKCYFSISLGQGQDTVAEATLEMAHRQGHWVHLNNIHLMPKWLIILEQRLDNFSADKPHDNFRVFLDSDPSKAIPIGLLEICIKLTDDPPTGLKANLKAGLRTIKSEEFDDYEPPLKALVFGLCYFHAVMLERKKFGSKGFNMSYPFSIQDLTCSILILKNYRDALAGKIPWADLQYLFGEIIYGGHIVNDFDRILCKKYMEFFIMPSLLEETVLVPYPDVVQHDYFKVPELTTYDKMLEEIDGHLKGESPIYFGLHPNAEIGFQMAFSEELLERLADLAGSTSDSKTDESGETFTTRVEAVLMNLLDAFQESDIEEYNPSMDDIGPYQNVLLQELERMRTLIVEMVKSLNELQLGFKGELTMTESMESLQECLSKDTVSPTWAKLAYPSLRPLAMWVDDLKQRIHLLNDWTDAVGEVPKVMWIAGLFNPQSFLTAIMQVTAHKNKLELDKLTILTDVTRKVDAGDIPSSRDGAFITGLSMEGAQWNTKENQIEPSFPKQMFCPMPIILCRAAMVERFDTYIFHCPVYRTLARGQTFIFMSNLKTKAPVAKWILAGVILVMDTAA